MISLKSSSIKSDLKTEEEKKRVRERDCLTKWNHNQISKLRLNKFDWLFNFHWLTRFDRLTKSDQSGWPSLTEEMDPMMYYTWV